MIYSINLNHWYSIMFLFLHLVCLHDDDAVKNNPIIIVLCNHEGIVFTPCLFAYIDDAVNNNPIIVLFNHEGIAILETMALNSETVKCWLLSMCSRCSIYEWYICRSRNWEVSIDFEVLITKLRRFNWFWSLDFEFRYMKGNLHWFQWRGTSEKLRYIRVFDI